MLRKKFSVLFIAVATLVVTFTAVAPMAMAESVAPVAADEMLAGHVAGEAVPEGIAKYHYVCWWSSAGLSGTANYRKVSKDAFLTDDKWAYTGYATTVAIGWPGRERLYAAWTIRRKGSEYRWVLR